MSADARTKQPPRKRRWRWLIWLLPLLLVGGFFINRLLQPEKLGELLLAQLNERSGLVITTSEPARVGWWPRLHVELAGVDARIPGDDAPLLQAEALDLSLPLSLLSDAVRGNEIQPRITGLHLQAPTLDLVRLQYWLGPDEGPPAPYLIPEIDSPLSIENGVVFGDGWRIEKLDVELDELHAAQPSRLLGSLSYLPSAQDGAPLPLAFDLLATPTINSGDLRLNPFHVELQSGEDHVSASGALRTGPTGTLQADLVVKLPRWPDLMPALPLPSENKSFTAKLGFDGQTSGHGGLELDIISEADRIQGELMLGDWLSWLGSDDESAWMLPPISGSLTATRLQQGDIVLGDAVIDFDDGSADATSNQP